ncbi:MULTISPECIES: hypothetical protein [Bacteroidales]|jgi:hypothetical protein|uniref:hypothetical protein n=1 Tax=Bacteroidales TaxID=171549 RepID=UPI000D14213E|nr:MULTISPECIES: hypothetical protein [Bacteroidales]PWB10212.1 hypothetical protein C5O72_08100 [Muribaculum intestinale]
MNTIYEQALAKVENGSRFRVNFQNRSLKIDGKYVIKDGKYDGELGVELTDSPLEQITQLYTRYQHSLPSERSENKRKCYFKSLPEHLLNDEDMLYGRSREYTQIALELYVLGVILNGSLKWDDFAKGLWFWQSPENKDLILLREWIEPQNTNNE